MGALGAVKRGGGNLWEKRSYCIETSMKGRIESKYVKCLEKRHLLIVGRQDGARMPFQPLRVRLFVLRTKVLIWRDLKGAFAADWPVAGAFDYRNPAYCSRFHFPITEQIGDVSAGAVADFLASVADDRR